MAIKAKKNIAKWLLVKLFIIQEVNNETRQPLLGRGYRIARRLNPYNPLSYITVLITLIVGIVMFGIVGFWKEVDFVNPFKWN